MSALQRIKRYLLDGVFILLPIALVIFLFEEMFGILEVGADALAQFVPRTQIAGVEVTHWIALILLVLLAIGVGFVSRTYIGAKVGSWCQQQLLEYIPAYSVFHDLGKRLSGIGTSTRFSPAVVEMPMNTKVLAFIVEELENGDYVVLIPTAPTPMVGQIQHVGRGRVSPLDVPLTQATNCISSWGLDSGRLFQAASPGKA